MRRRADSGPESNCEGESCGEERSDAREGRSGAQAAAATDGISGRGRQRMRGGRRRAYRAGRLDDISLRGHKHVKKRFRARWEGRFGSRWVKCDIAGSLTSDPYVPPPLRFCHQAACSTRMEGLSHHEALPPSGDVLSESTKELIIKHWKISNQTKADMTRLAGMFATSYSSVKRVLNHWRVEGTARCPRQGQGKRSSVRWIFAGPRGAANLKLLEQAEAAGPVHDSILNIRNR